MNIQPLSVLLTIVGGLILAGLLGWIKKPRLVVFVPRLFSHSRISDKGQIIEISIMNRGFKTEENIELSLSPSMHYELVGSNNPDASLTSSKLIVPRIGSTDDCSVLLQVEGGKFSHSEIVNCLSKETKATVATKLEDVPVTAQQRVGFLMFFGGAALFALLLVTGFDYLKEKTVTPSKTAETASAALPIKDTQGWTIGSVYQRDENHLYQAIIKQQLIISTGPVQTKNNTATVPIIADNKSADVVTLIAELISSTEQDPLSFSKRRLSNAVLFPGDSKTKELQVLVPTDISRRKVIVEIFVQSTEGETLSARKILDLGKS